MEEESKKSKFLAHLMAWAEKDWIIIMVAIAVLGACLLTLNSVGDYQDRINQAWMDQWQASGCAARYSVPNISFNLGGGNSEAQDRNQNTSWPGYSNS